MVAVSSGADARAALEMIMAVHESQRLKTRVSFPLENRENPYEVWRSGDIRFIVMPILCPDSANRTQQIII